MTGQFELILLLDEVTAEQEDLIYDEYDALLASHADGTRLVVTVEGANVVDGAHRLLAFLAAAGARVRQFCEDFVSRGDVAERAGVSRQAVGLWVRGERQGDFPPMYSPVAGGIWLFGEVNAWLTTNVASYEPPQIGFPTRADHLALAALLQTEERDADDGSRDLLLSAEISLDVGEDVLSRAVVVTDAPGWARVATVRGVDLRLVA